MHVMRNRRFFWMARSLLLVTIMKNVFQFSSIRAALFTTFVAGISVGTFGCSAEANTSSSEGADVTEGVAQVTTLLSQFRAVDPNGQIATWDLSITHAKLKTYTSLVGFGTDGVAQVQFLLMHDTADEVTKQPSAKIKDQGMLFALKTDVNYDALVRSESERISRHLADVVANAGTQGSQVSTMSNSKVATKACPTLIEMMIGIGGLAAFAAYPGLFVGIAADIATAGLVIAVPAALVGAVVVGMVVVPWVLVAYDLARPQAVCSSPAM
jgi:hypothetical protein